MKYSRYLQTIKRSSIFSRRLFSDDPGKTFRDKGLGEENRYFLKKQHEELILLRRQLQLLTKHHLEIQKKLDATEKAISDMAGVKDTRNQK